MESCKAKVMALIENDIRPCLEPSKHFYIDRLLKHVDELEPILEFVDKELRYHPRGWFVFIHIIIENAHHGSADNVDRVRENVKNLVGESKKNGKKGRIQEIIDTASQLHKLIAGSVRYDGEETIEDIPSLSELESKASCLVEGFPELIELVDSANRIAGDSGQSPQYYNSSPLQIEGWLDRPVSKAIQAINNMNSGREYFPNSRFLLLALLESVQSLTVAPCYKEVSDLTGLQPGSGKTRQNPKTRWNHVIQGLLDDLCRESRSDLKDKLPYRFVENIGSYRLASILCHILDGVSPDNLRNIESLIRGRINHDKEVARLAQEEELNKKLLPYRKIQQEQAYCLEKIEELLASGDEDETLPYFEKLKDLRLKFDELENQLVEK